MARSMKVFGKTTCTTEGESFIMQVVTFMKENSSTIWPRASGSTDMLTVQSMLGIGIRTNSMALGKRSGTIQACIKDSTRTPAKKDKANTTGQMATDTSVNGARTCSTEEACSSGMMIGSSSEIGRTT